MILSYRDMPEPALMVWDGTEPEETLAQKELRRAALTLRLQRIGANPDFRVLEGFEYTDVREALLARGELTDRLLTALEKLDDEIEELRHA